MLFTVPDPHLPPVCSYPGQNTLTFSYLTPNSIQKLHYVLQDSHNPATVYLFDLLLTQL